MQIFCVEALNDALVVATPLIMNTDQGAQFTSASFTNRLKDKGIAISMDSKGHAIDNVMIERLWRTVKYSHHIISSAILPSQIGLTNPAKEAKSQDTTRPRKLTDSPKPFTILFNHSL